MSRSLIPDAPGTTPNAWCTWATQNLSTSAAAGEPAGPVRFDGDQGARSGRDHLHEGVVFGPGGRIEDWPAVRGDLHFLFDDGWDVPFGTHPSGDGLAAFGALELAEDRFPSCGGAPAARLARLNDQVRAAGWRGAGLWVAAQRQGEQPAEAEVWVSEQWLTDSCAFAPHSTWWSAVFERTIAQTAPAVIARGLELPVVLHAEAAK